MLVVVVISEVPQNYVAFSFEIVIDDDGLFQQINSEFISIFLELLIKYLKTFLIEINNLPHFSDIKTF